MSNFIEQLTTSFIVGGLALFAISLGFFAIYYLSRRRQMLHQERMASLIKGLHFAGVAHDVFAKQPRKHESRDHLLSGLRWLFGATGASGAMYGYQSMQPVSDAGAAASAALIGLIPGAIGLAHLLFSWICSRRQALPTLPPLIPGAGAYRVARVTGRRF
jgi:TRAP-type uncharacterized transport system fused permease subunit